MFKCMSAAGEAMPKISRRLFLGSAAVSLPLMGASLTLAATPDPLAAACAAYVAALEDYNANAPSEDAAANAYAATTWKPARDVLENWTEPAVSRDGAMAALRLAAREEEDTGYSGLTSPLLTAALAYFEKEALQ